jgi:hypothetical protein
MKRKNDIKLLMIADDDLDTLTIMKKSLKSDAKVKVYCFTSPVTAVKRGNIQTRL